MDFSELEHYTDWFFDLDGTLTDSAADILCLLNAVLTEEVVQCSPVERKHIGPPLEDIIRTLCPNFSSEQVTRIVQIYRPRYRQCPFAQSPLYPGILPLFTQLKAQGARLYVATNKPVDVTTRLLGLRGLLPFLTDIVCSNSSPERRLSKAEMLVLLMERHEILPEQGIMAGDSILDMQGAQTVGMATLAVLYGYGAREALLAAQPDFIVDDPDWTSIRRTPN